MAFEDFERETCIWYSKEKDSLATVSTYDTSVINMLDKYCKQYPDKYKLIREIIIDGAVEGKEYSLPKKLVTIHKPSSRKLTDEQKKAAGERLKKTKEKKSIKEVKENKKSN